MSINNEESEHIEEQSVEEQYKSCTQKYENSKKISEFQQLKTEFWSLGDYEYSRDYVQLCNASIRKIYKKRIAIGSIIAAVLIIGVFILFASIIPTVRYNDALSDLKMKKYSKAYKEFNELEDFKDSKCLSEYSNIKKSNVGDIVKFGVNEEMELPYDNDRYSWQDFVPRDAVDKRIEWRIVDKHKDKALMVCEYLYNGMDYLHQDYASDELESDASWEESTIRSFLNSSYYNSVFNESEKNMIVKSTIKNDVWSDYSAPNDGDTEDKVFLLSFKEINEYFPSENERIAYELTEQKAACWWTRTPARLEEDRGEASQYAVMVGFQGMMYTPDSKYEANYTYDAGGIRPAIWVDISDKR